MSYVDEVLEKVVAKNPAEPEFHQAVKEVLESLRVVVEANEEKFRKDALLERLVEPERQIKFRVPWVDDKGKPSGMELCCSIIKYGGRISPADPCCSVVMNGLQTKLDPDKPVRIQ